jgi:hypothetical protein
MIQKEKLLYHKFEDNNYTGVTAAEVLRIANQGKVSKILI